MYHSRIQEPFSLFMNVCGSCNSPFIMFLRLLVPKASRFSFSVGISFQFLNSLPGRRQVILGYKTRLQSSCRTSLPHIFVIDLLSPMGCLNCNALGPLFITNEVALDIRFVSSRKISTSILIA